MKYIFKLLLLTLVVSIPSLASPTWSSEDTEDDSDNAINESDEEDKSWSSPESTSKRERNIETDTEVEPIVSLSNEHNAVSSKINPIVSVAVDYAAESFGDFLPRYETGRRDVEKKETCISDRFNGMRLTINKWEKIPYLCGNMICNENFTISYKRCENILSMTDSSLNYCLNTKTYQKLPSKEGTSVLYIFEDYFPNYERISVNSVNSDACFSERFKMRLEFNLWYKIPTVKEICGNMMCDKDYIVTYRRCEHDFNADQSTGIQTVYNPWFGYASGAYNTLVASNLDIAGEYSASSWESSSPYTTQLSYGPGMMLVNPMQSYSSDCLSSGCQLPVVYNPAPYIPAQPCIYNC